MGVFTNQNYLDVHLLLNRLIRAIFLPHNAERKKIQPVNLFQEKRNLNSTFPTISIHRSYRLVLTLIK